MGRKCANHSHLLARVTGDCKALSGQRGLINLQGLALANELRTGEGRAGQEHSQQMERFHVLGDSCSLDSTCRQPS